MLSRSIKASYFALGFVPMRVNASPSRKRGTRSCSMLRFDQRSGSDSRRTAHGNSGSGALFGAKAMLARVDDSLILLRRFALAVPPRRSARREPMSQRTAWRTQHD